MNKQEVMKILTDTKHDYEFCWSDDFRTGFIEGINCSLKAINQLDEPVKPPEPEPWQPEKPIVPQYVADWYEENKDDFENSLAILIRDYFKGEIEDDNLLFWFGYDLSKDQPIKTLVNMHQFGYEVEKEKLYTVFQLATKEYLFRFHTGVLESLKVSKKHAQKIKDYHFTQAELEELQYWDNPAFEIVEVKR